MSLFNIPVFNLPTPQTTKIHRGGVDLNFERGDLVGIICSYNVKGFTGYFSRYVVGGYTRSRFFLEVFNVLAELTATHCIREQGFVVTVMDGLLIQRLSRSAILSMLHQDNVIYVDGVPVGSFFLEVR